MQTNDGMITNKNRCLPLTTTQPSIQVIIVIKIETNHL
jgi:hypothetical protein